MTTFVFVHGGWHGGWCWKLVSEQLRRFGHEVYTPTLTGLGERIHLANPVLSWDIAVDDIVGVIEAGEAPEVKLLRI